MERQMERRVVRAGNAPGSAPVDQLNALQSALTVPGSDLVTSREASREPTRDRIVAAAVRSLIEEGYAATTTLRVQHRAGVSRGALLHHFPRREDLFVAAVHQLVDDTLDEVRGELKRMPPEPDPASRTVWMLRRASTSRSFAAQLELWGAARTDPALRAALRGAERPAIYHLRDLLGEVFGPEISAAPRYPLFRSVIIQVMRGMAVANGLASERQPAEAVLYQVAEFTRLVLEGGATEEGKPRCLAG
jgi:AcrR family transcriptional regulator